MRVRSWVIGLILIAVGTGGVAGCGSSSSSSSSSSTPSSSSSGTTASPTSASSSTASGRPAHAVVPLARRLERALRRSRATPAVSSASCRAESMAQRSASPFGSAGPPVYACMLARGPARTVYDVQVLPTGCFVAERRAPGIAIYGCGAGRT